MAPSPPVSGEKNQLKHGTAEVSTNAKCMPDAGLTTPEEEDHVEVLKRTVPVDLSAVALKAKAQEVAPRAKVLVDKEVGLKGNVPVDGLSKATVPDDQALKVVPRVAFDEGAEVPCEIPAIERKQVSISKKPTVKLKVPVVERGNEIAVKTNADKENITKEDKVRENNEFQHYHYHALREGALPMGCERCTKIQELLDHKEHPDTCYDCQLITAIIKFHKKVCRHGNGCPFCQAIKEKENVDGAQGCTDPPSQCEVISEVFTPIPGGIALEKGTSFIYDTHYSFGDPLGEGGNGLAFMVNLHELGVKTLFGTQRIESDIRLAAKVTNVYKNEIEALKTLNGGPNIAPHYFLVNCTQELLKKNWKTKTDEFKTFKQVLFMEMADLSLKGLRGRYLNCILPLKDACIYFRETVNAVIYCHSRGISHNDIKSGNVLMFPDVKTYYAALCDFEFATIKGRPFQRRGGTRFFQPPKPSDGADFDTYALGIFFLELAICGTCCVPNDESSWPRIKAAKVDELKSKHLEIGLIIEACLKQKLTLDRLKRRLDEIGGEEGWWPVIPNVLKL